MCKLDLKDVYFMAPIQSWSQKFIRFQFQGRTYQFTCLPFGLSSAPRIFTKLLKPVTGILENLGFLINMAKSIFIPVQVIEFLGIIVDSTNMMFLLPDEKVVVIQKESRHLVSWQVASLSQHSHIIGKLTSCKIAVLQAPLHYREIQHLKNSSTHFQLVSNADYSSGSPCSRGSKLVGRQSSPRKWAPHSELPTTLVIQSDASNLGGGHGQRRKPIFTWIAKSY